MRVLKFDVRPQFGPIFPSLTTIAGGAATAPGASIDGVGTSARFGAPTGLIFDAASQRIFVADAGFSLIRVIQLQVMKTGAGNVSTLAGGATDGHADGAGSVARFAAPWAFAAGSSGRGGGGSGDGGLLLFVTEARNFQLRAIAERGGAGGGVAVTTLAGGMGAVFKGVADGIGTAAGFGAPLAATFITLRGVHTIAVADAGAGALRLVTPAANCSGGGEPCAAAAPLRGAKPGSLALPLFAAASGVALFAAAAIAARGAAKRCAEGVGRVPPGARASRGSVGLDPAEPSQAEDPVARSRGPW